MPSSVSRLGEDISIYIAQKYGEKQLGIVRLLTSFPYFRRALIKEKLPALLGMSLFSFEKVLREEHGIFYRSEEGQVTLSRKTDGGIRSTAYQDDEFRSVAGAILHHLRAAHPELASFQQSPVLQSSGGINAVAIVDGSAAAALHCAVLKHRTALEGAYPDRADDIATIITYPSLVGPERRALDCFRFCEAAHRLLVDARTCAQNRKRKPEVSKEEITDIVLGLAPAEEVGSIPAAFLRSKIFKEGILELYPFLEEQEDGTLAAFVGPSLAGELTTVATPRKPLEDLGSAALVKAQETKPGCSLGSTAPRSELPSASRKVVDKSAFPELDAAYEHVVHYAEVDVAGLPKSEQTIAWFGSKVGRDAFKKASKSWQKDLNKDLPASGIGTELLVLLATHIKKRLTRLTHHEALFLAAGRFVSWKGAWEFEADGTWLKRAAARVDDESSDED